MEEIHLQIKHPSDVSNMIKSFNNSKNNALCLLKKCKDGDYCDNPEESLNVLLNKFFPGHTLVPENEVASTAPKHMDWNVIKNN